MIIWIRFRDRAHGVGERGIERATFCFGPWGGVAFGQRIDVGLLARAHVRLALQRFLESGPGERDRRFVHGRVDVRTMGKRLAPVSHRALGIERGGGAE